MMAPHFERAAILCVCIRTAAQELEGLIDRIEVDNDKVVVGGGGKTVTLVARYADAIGPDGAVAPGGGRWVAQRVEENNAGIVMALRDDLVQQRLDLIRLRSRAVDTTRTIADGPVKSEMMKFCAYLDMTMAHIDMALAGSAENP